MDVVTILGAGSHGRDIECIAIDCGWFVEYLDDDPAKGYDRIYEFDNSTRFTIGAWEPRSRSKIWDRLNHYKAQPATLIHPAARIGRDCHIGPGCVIGPGAILTNDVVLGHHVHVGAGALLTRCFVDEFSTISNGATILGDVRVGKTVLIGGNAVVKNLKTVGDGAVVGMGSTVTRDIEANTVVAGNPAKTIGRLP